MIDRITPSISLLIPLVVACSSSGGPPAPTPNQEEVELAERFEHRTPLGTADAILWCNPIPTCAASGKIIRNSPFSSVPELAEIMPAASFKGGVAIVVASERNPAPFWKEEEQFLDAVVNHLRTKGFEPLGLFYMHSGREATRILECRLTRRCS